MQAKYKYLSKNVLLFSISSFLPKVISFLMIPLYTSILTTNDYGYAELISTTVALLIPVFTLDIQDAVMRYAFDKNYSHGEVFSVAINIVIKGAIPVLLGCVGCWLFSVPGAEGQYIFFVIWQYITAALLNSCNLFCRGIDKVQVLTISSLIQSVANAALNVLMLVVIPLGFTGYMLAGSISSTVGLLYIFVAAKLYRYIQFPVNKGLQRKMIHFSLPLIFSVLAWWVNNASDRYIVTGMVSVAASGLYTVSSKIPNILVAFQGVFYQAWSISAVKEFDSKDTDHFISQMYTMTNVAMIMLCSLLILFNIPLAHILYLNDFFPAWQYVPPLLIAVVFNTIALFVGSIYTAVKETKILSYTTISGAAINTVLNFLLIWKIGVYGAAIATMIGFLSVMVCRLYFLKRYITMHVNFKRDFVGYALLILQALVARGGNDTILFQLAITFGIGLLYRKTITMFIGRFYTKIKNKIM